MAAVRISKFALAWFMIVTPLVLIDGVFVLTRAPASAADHTHPLANVVPFKYWTIYAKYDRRYGSNDDAFVVAQSYLNMAEVALGVVVVLLELVGGAHAAAMKLSIVVCMMTLYKTVIYYAMDVVEGHRYTKQNSPKEQFLMVLLPSSFWLIVPSLILVQCFKVLQIGEAKAAAPSRRVSTASPKKARKSM